MRGGLNPKDKVLKEKGFYTINDFCRILNKGRYTISTVLKYLYIQPQETIGKHIFYASDVLQMIKNFYMEHPDYEKFLAKEMRKRKYGGSGYEGRETKTKATCIQKYGENYRNIFTQKMKSTIKEKYGDENYRNLDKGKETRQLNRIKFCKDNDCSAFSDIFGTRVEHSWETLQYCMSENSIKLLTYKNTLYIKNKDIEILKEALKSVKDVKFSTGEKELYNFVKSLGFTVIENDREILTGKELDIYIPEKKVAVEFNGLRWHSVQFKHDKNYHLDKTLLCEKQGIRLIHIFEDEWLTQKPIVESLIKSAVGVYQRRIYARNCQIKEISAETFRDFCNTNHIQGNCQSSIRLGLFFNEELVQAVGFAKSRFYKDCEWELIRMCTLLNTQVLGGFSKLMKAFNQDCVSYIDRRLFNGKGYEASNFRVIGINPPSFYYTKGLSRFYRMNFTKQNIKKKFPDKYNDSLTEEENMKNLGYYRIYDCGTIKVVYNQKN